ncbi:MAG: hypothetical protein Q7R73_02570 [bacterium]|nr:hypothetical protein [bacterium]
MAKKSEKRKSGGREQKRVGVKKERKKNSSVAYVIETSVFPAIVGETTLENPLVIETPKSLMPIIHAINTPMIGVCADTHPYRNPFSNALRLAEVHRRHADVVGAPVVLVTGNLIHVDTKKYSKLRVHRALVEQTKPITLSELNMEEDREANFISVENRIKDRIEMLKKASLDEGGKPLYNGPIYCPFGKCEEEIIQFWVDEHTRKVVAEKQEKLRMERSFLRAGVKSAAKQMGLLQKAIAKDTEALQGLDRVAPSDERENNRRVILESIAKLQVRLQEEQVSFPETEAKLRDVIGELENTRATTCDAADIKRWFFEGQLRLKQMIEEAVPNARVISTGKCFVKVGDKVISVVQKDTDSTTDVFIDKLSKKIQKEQKNGKRQPDLILIGGLNLAPTDFSIKYPKADGLPREIAEVAIVQLPTCLDNDYIEKITARGIKIGTEITKLINDEDFTSGMLSYCWPSEFPQSRFWSSNNLADETIFEKNEEIEKLVLGSYQIYGEHEGDMQEGAHHQAYYSVPGFPSKKPLYAVHHDFFVKIAAPIHHYVNLGDIVQGENHEYHLEIPEDYRITHELVADIDTILRDAGLTGDQKAEKVGRLAELNSFLGGTPRVDHQLKNYEVRAIIGGAKYFCMVLNNARRVRLEFIEKAGVITAVGGNHFGNTGRKNSGGVGKHFEESEIVREALIKMLRKCAGFTDEDLDRLVVAEKISGVSGALGAFGILPDGMKREDIAKLSKAELKKIFPYCLSAKHKPSGQGTSSKGLPVKSLRRARSERGPTDPLYEGRFALELAGHIDRDTTFISRGSLYSISPAQEFRSPFAESLDFGLGDIGTKVIGVPKDRKGPIVITRFTYEVFFRYLKNPWRINVKQLFPNAL